MVATVTQQVRGCVVRYGVIASICVVALAHGLRSE